MEACKASSLDEVMERVTRAEIRLDHGPFSNMSPEVLSKALGSAHASKLAHFCHLSSHATYGSSATCALCGSNSMVVCM